MGKGAGDSTHNPATPAESEKPAPAPSGRCQVTCESCGCRILANRDADGQVWLLHGGRRNGKTMCWPCIIQSERYYP